MKDKLIKDLTNHLVDSILNESEGVEEIKVNNPNITPEEVWDYIDKYPDSDNFFSTKWREILYQFHFDPNSVKYHGTKEFIKQLSQSDLIKFYQEVKQYLKEDKIPGGLSNKKTAQDIASHHKVQIEQINRQLLKGIKVELEHTSDRKIAREIATDHLWEDPNYYDKLEKIETNEIRVNSPQKYKINHKEGKDYIIINGKEFWGEWYVNIGEYGDGGEIEFGVKLPEGFEKQFPKEWKHSNGKYFIPEKNTINTLREIISTQNLQENQFPKSDSFKKFVNYLNELVNYVCKDLKITRPDIKLINNTNYTQENHSFGGYQPGADSIYLVIKNRNCRDVCVTLAHELRHHWQYLNDKIKPGDGKDGDEIENDAQIYAGMTLRKFGRENPEIFELLN